MLNTRDLEERWLKYKIKSYIPHTTIAVSLLVIIVISSIFLNSDKEEKEISILPNIKKVKQIENIQKVVTHGAEHVTEKALSKIKTIQIKKTTIEEVPQAIVLVSQNNLQNNNDASLKLSPSLDFMKKMQHSSLPYYQEETNTEQNVNSNEPIYTSQIVEEVQELGIEETKETPVVEEVESKKITIQRRDSSDDIRGIIKRFKKNNNPALSLFIAKKYYELGEYHKAYNYALITNEINREIDASWIVFTKSLVKMNQKDMAIKTLKKYIENSHSNSAKILLDEIVSGKFK